eukprot:5083276-Prymnesium_polylepis.2
MHSVTVSYDEVLVALSGCAMSGARWRRLREEPAPGHLHRAQLWINSLRRGRRPPAVLLPGR